MQGVEIMAKHPIDLSYVTLSPSCPCMGINHIEFWFLQTLSKNKMCVTSFMLNYFERVGHKSFYLRMHYAAESLLITCNDVLMIELSFICTFFVGFATK